MKHTRFAWTQLSWMLIIGTILLVPSVSISAQTRAIKPVRIEAKTAQNETVSYIYAESHALVIGVSQYRNGWSNLPGVQEDVEEVSQSLAKNGFQVTRIEDPGLDELENAIEDFIFEKGTNPENRLLIYYAGHGHTMTLGYGGEMGFLVPADAPVPQKGRDAKFRRQALSMQRIEEVAKNTSAKHVLFMFDACFAGSVFLATRAAPAYIQQNTKEPVRQFITSGSAEQEVPDKSIFRRAFVDALDGKADYDQDGYLTGTELGAYIQKRTAEDWEGRLTPQYGKLQDPNLNKGDFVFELSKPEMVKPPPAEPAPVAPPPDLAAQAWSMIENSENPKAFELFLQEFPESAQASLAKLKLMLLPPPTAAIKKEEPIPESQNEVVKASPVTPLLEPITPPLEQSVVISNETGSNSRYRWTAEIVEDKEKGLIWQRKDGGERSFSGAQIHCNKLSLDEANNWRVPKFKELSELLKGEFATEIFGKISRGFYWATNSSGTEIFDPWEGSGRAALLGRYNTLCVRDLVNSLDLNNEEKIVKSKFNSSFGNNERYRWTPVIVEDKQTKRIWQRQDNGERTFEWAKSYCEGLRVGGDTNWRLPEIGELRELLGESDSRSDGTSELFNELRRGSYWSGTILSNARVRFQNPWDDKGGIAARYGKDSKYTLCVRNTTITAPNASSTTNLYDSKSSEKTAPKNPQKEKKIVLNLFSGENERYRWTPVIVEDKQTKRIWQRQDNGERTFEWAKSYCEGLRVGGDTNWRLPEIGELRELLGESDSRSDGTSELFNELRRGSYWSGTLLSKARVRFQNPWDDKGGIAARYGKDSKYALCVRSSDGSTPKSSSTVNLYSSNNSSSKTKKNEIQSSFQKGLEYSSYQKIAESNTEVVGCGFFHVGCLEEPLKFPPYQPNFHIKDYRRVHLWGKDRPWTDTELQLQNGDQVYFYGTGEVTTCPHSSCSGRGPQNLNKGSLSYKISEGASPGNLNRFTRIRYGSSGFKSSIQARSNGALYLSVRDWNTYPPPSNYYDDNSGVYILDIFVIDPDQEDGFNRFKDALFKVNPNDSNAKAYLGR